MTDRTTPSTWLKRTSEVEAAQKMAHDESLEDLFAQAERFGRVTVFANHQFEPNTYSAQIEFPTIAGTSLKAKSGFGLPLKDALREAISKAHQIRNHFKDTEAS